MPLKLVKNKILLKELKKLARERFGDLVKAVVDVEKQVMVVGGELHTDEEAFLLEKGSRQDNLWGINIYPDVAEKEMIEFDSVINIRPTKGNMSRYVESLKLRQRIRKIVKKLVHK